MTTRNCGHGSLGEWNPCPMCEIKRLEAENAELKAHIQRWRLHNYPGHHHKEGTHFNCEVCNIHWPCPTEVAKGWKE